MPEITPTPADDTTGAAAGAAAGAGAPESEPKLVSMTQEQLDRMIADRVARAKPKDYDDLVKIRDAQAAAAEKEKSDLDKEREARKASDAKASAAVATANARLRSAAILAEAATQGAADPGMIAQLLASSESITVDDDGEVAGADAAVKKLLKDKPFLVKAATPGASGGEFGGVDQKSLDEQIQAAEAAKNWTLSRQLKMQKLGRV